MTPMMADIPTSPTKAPSPEQFNQVVDAQANKMQESLDALAPVGDFSAPRLSALGKALDSVVKLFSDSIPPTPVIPAIRKGKLPGDLLLRIVACKAAADAFNAANPDEDPVVITDVKDLGSDAAIAMLTVNLQKLGGSKAFKSWLKQPAPEAPVEEHAEPAGHENEPAHAGEAGDLSNEQNEDMNTLFGNK